MCGAGISWKYSVFIAGFLNKASFSGPISSISGPSSSSTTSRVPGSLHSSPLAPRTKISPCPFSRFAVCFSARSSFSFLVSPRRIHLERPFSRPFHSSSMSLQHIFPPDLIKKRKKKAFSFRKLQLSLIKMISRPKSTPLSPPRKMMEKERM